MPTHLNMPMPRFARIVQQHDVLRLKKDQQFFIDPESMADGYFNPLFW
jgi:hypothetical protein